MTPAARIAAAIEILDQVLAGRSAEQALTNWGRASRFAGSGDRAALRDLVFGALRCKLSFAALGGSETGRGLMIGAMRAAGEAPEALLTGVGHAPAPLGESEVGRAPAGLAALDCPEWLAPALQASLGERFEPVMALLQSRAPVFLRVNLARGDQGGAVAALAAEEIVAVAHPLCATALQVMENARKIQGSRAFADGLVEVQDAASQAIVAGLPLAGAPRVLDYCAGGGGKALAMAALGAQVWAHDAAPRRMRDLPARAERAGVRVPVLDAKAIGRQVPFDLVLLDVPCSGSGSWRRSPEAKWALTPERLAELRRIQAGILDVGSQLVRRGGTLAYATCSLLEGENRAQVQEFLARVSDWQLAGEQQLTPLDGGDGFYIAHLTRE